MADAQDRYIVDLLRYAARLPGATTTATEARFGGHDLVGVVAENENVDGDEARAMLRAAVTALGGREITNTYDPELIGYAIPLHALAKN